MSFTDRLQQSFSLLWEFLPAFLGAGLSSPVSSSLRSLSAASRARCDVCT